MLTRDIKGEITIGKYALMIPNFIKKLEYDIGTYFIDSSYVDKYIDNSLDYNNLFYEIEEFTMSAQDLEETRLLLSKFQISYDIDYAIQDYASYSDSDINLGPKMEYRDDENNGKELFIERIGFSSNKEINNILLNTSLSKDEQLMKIEECSNRSLTPISEHSKKVDNLFDSDLFNHDFREIFIAAAGNLPWLLDQNENTEKKDYITPARFVEMKIKEIERDDGKRFLCSSLLPNGLGLANLIAYLMSDISNMQNLNMKSFDLKMWIDDGISCMKILNRYGADFNQSLTNDGCADVLTSLIKTIDTTGAGELISDDKIIELIKEFDIDIYNNNLEKSLYATSFLSGRKKLFNYFIDMEVSINDNGGILNGSNNNKTINMYDKTLEDRAFFVDSIDNGFLIENEKDSDYILASFISKSSRLSLEDFKGEFENCSYNVVIDKIKSLPKKDKNKIIENISRSGFPNFVSNAILENKESLSDDTICENVKQKIDIYLKTIEPLFTKDIISELRLSYPRKMNPPFNELFLFLVELNTDVDKASALASDPYKFKKDMSNVITTSFVKYLKILSKDESIFNFVGERGENSLDRMIGREGTKNNDLTDSVIIAVCDEFPELLTNNMYEFGTFKGGGTIDYLFHFEKHELIAKIKKGSLKSTIEDFEKKNVAIMNSSLRM